MPGRKRPRMTRDQKMDRVLKPLSGKQREAMEVILRTVPTSQLQTGYDKFIDRVKKLKE